MLDLTWGGAFAKVLGGRTPRGRSARKPRVEGLEGRQLLVASIGSIADVTVPQSLGYQVPIDGSAANAPQTFTVTSSNPDVKATIATGPFETLNVTHTAASGNSSDDTFTGSVTFQLFNDLTPTTVGKFETFINDGYYTNKTIHRIAGNFTGQNLANDFVIQGGAPNSDGSGSSGQPGTPYGIEPVQQLSYASPGALAVARGNSTDSNDTQFFIATGTPTSLDYQYTIFGQVVAGAATIADLEGVATTTNASLGGEKSLPISPVTITGVTLSNTNPNGVIHVDATGAVAGETSTITVTAADASTGTTASRTFNVTVGADTTTHPTTLTFKPLAFPVTAQAQTATATAVQLNGTTQNPNNSAVTVGYAIASQPSHGTITNFNATTGSLTYTSAAGYTGADSFTYSVTNTGGTPSPLAGNTQTVSLTVTATAPVVVTPQVTDAVRVVGGTLIITPRPRTPGSRDTIVVNETSNAADPAADALVVSINGVYDSLQPLASAINRIVIYGSKSSQTVTVLPNVDPSIRVTLDGGHGGVNYLQAGSGTTREHGWFGKTTLVGGPGANQLVGRKGNVFFRPTATTDQIYASNPADRKHPRNVGGTYYRFVKGKVVKALDVK